MQSYVSLPRNMPFWKSEPYSGCRCTLFLFGTTAVRQGAQKPANKVPINLNKRNDFKPYRVVIKGIPPTTPTKAIQDELLALGLAVQNVIPMTTWRDRMPLPMHIIELDNVPQSQKISQLFHLCYIIIIVEAIRDAPCRLSAHSVSNSFTWRQIVRPLRFAPTVQRNTARSKAINVWNRTSCPSALCAKSEITAGSTEVATVRVTSLKTR
jgi:hypothetical protein